MRADSLCAPTRALRRATFERWHFPDDIIETILRIRAATDIQARWRGYRTQVLVGRFRLLRFVRVFASFNANIGVFMRRSRL